MTIRIRGAADVLSALPYMLGFRPTESLVIVALGPSSEMICTARFDLTDAEDPKLRASTLATLASQNVAKVVLAVMQEGFWEWQDVMPYAELVTALESEVLAAGMTVVDSLLSIDDRYWSYQCSSDACCPPEGRVLPAATSEFQAAAVLRGIAPAASRAEVAERFTPDKDAERLAPLLLAAWVEPQDHVEQSMLVLTWAEVGVPAEDDLAVRLGVALRDLRVRDIAWMALDGGSPTFHPGAWLDLARRLPAPFNAAPLFLYGWGMWRRGNGAVASMAADRALAADPDYSAAALLNATLAAGANPRSLPKLDLAKLALSKAAGA